MTVFSDPPQNLFWKPFTSENARKLDKRREQQLGEPSEEPFPRRTHATKNPRRQKWLPQDLYYGWRPQIKHCWGTKRKHAFPQNPFFWTLLIIQCPNCQAPSIQDCFFDVLRLWTTSQRSKASKDANHWKRLLADRVWESGKTRRLWLLFFQILKWTQIFDQPQKQVGGDHGIWMFPWSVGWWIMMCLQVRFFFPGFLSLSKLYVSLTSNTALHITFVSPRLDLTVNFVSVEEIEESFHLRAVGPWGTAVAHQIPSCQGVYNLKANMMLEDLYLTGNPCKNLSKLQGGAGSCWRVKAAGMLGMMFFPLGSNESS